MDIEPTWDHYRSFLAVCEEGSLSAAARSLGSTQPTLGSHVATLEQVLGQTLFVRSPEGLAPTDAARRMLPHAEALRDAAAALRRVVGSSDTRVSGTVRITCSEVVGVEVLPPILRDLREMHPDLTVELVVTDAMQDLLQRSADLAVRMAEPRQASLLRRRLGTIPLGLYAHRRYTERHGVPADMKALRRHAVVGYDRQSPLVRRMIRQGLPVEREMFALRTDNTLAQLAAVRAGIGIGFCQAPLARRDPDLVPVLPALMRAELPVWVAMHEDLRSIPRFRAAFDGLAAGLELYMAERD